MNTDIHSVTFFLGAEGAAKDAGCGVARGFSRIECLPFFIYIYIRIYVMDEIPSSSWGKKKEKRKEKKKKRKVHVCVFVSYDMTSDVWMEMFYFFFRSRE